MPLSAQMSSCPRPEGDVSPWGRGREKQVCEARTLAGNDPSVVGLCEHTWKGLVFPKTMKLRP